VVNNEDLAAATGIAAEAPATVKPAPRSCPRCQGRLFQQGSDGDRACFSCGHVVYTLAPLEGLEVARRTPSHGGWRLT